MLEARNLEYFIILYRRAAIIICSLNITLNSTPCKRENILKDIFSLPQKRTRPHTVLI